MRKAVFICLLIGSTFAATVARAATETAIYAGGCFWCVEHDLDQAKGVISTTSGYAGGATPDPTYDRHDGYREAVKVEFDPSVVTYSALTAYFLRTIDVLDGGGQFCDRGNDYVPTLYPLNAGQRSIAKTALKDVAHDLGEEPAVQIGANPSFFPAEPEHQDFYTGRALRLTWYGVERQSTAYKDYREGCGRDAQVKKVWGKMAFKLPH